MVEKDEYRLSNTRDVIRATHSAKAITVVELKKGFLALRLVEKTSYDSCWI